MKPIKVVLAGQPNVGKSSLINSMTDSRLKVGNFSGVTVEKSQVTFEHHCHILEIIDLPGTYSINGFSQEEKVARDFLQNEDYDVILNVVDSTHITRNLLLTLELLNMNKKMVIALNMIDEAKEEGITIDVAQIEAITGIPVIAVSANTKDGVDELLNKVHDIADDDNRLRSKVSYSDIIEEQIFTIKNFFDEDDYSFSDLNSREMAIKLLSEDENFFKEIHDKPVFMELQPLLIKCHDNIHTYFETKSHADIQAIEHNAISRGIKAETVSCAQPKNHKPLSKKIDDILINKFVGIPIFLFLMWGLFQLTFELGAIPMDYIDSLFSWLGDAVGMSIAHDGLRSLIVDGIIAGVGAVVLFLPNIIILYIGIALLETTGYMSRVAFLLDGFFHKFGLHGKSFIPLVTGFGCSVPAYMATRTLKNEKDRLITLFIIGFMSCGAKLPVYVLFAGAFFSPEVAGDVLFYIYIAGALLGLVMAKVLRVTVFKGDDEPFVMEMPKYRLPTLKLIYMIVSQKAWSYLKKAGTFILAATILIWFASNYPKHNSDNQALQLEHSYLGQVGKMTEPFFAPLGFDWKLSIALETGLAAKEVVVATLGILYNVGDEVDEESDELLNAIKEQIPFATAVSFIVFVMIYLPCFAASMVFAKEAGGYKYLAYLFIFTTVIAWLMSFIAYKIALLV
ncbi:MAG: ferrous iron transport protein B [Campylobacteraceae bacterium]|jgi:ferrous iron transport protein B|nr:ferrous iron transport protein B [Campylobacteraceae bacterium]MBT4572514.1 ferrous iron transport protein B [Campylobacteraceae bacterium]MBT5323855.1 ferrous iron transport protein B [Campylobacteraceae bacterium]MBT6577485.1 ferrous iron transport protein B [Campylobacteraceae bacterium]MBT7117487.1 ferrous iron transport protein B [Campylobacteraceae bacterium]